MRVESDAETLAAVERFGDAFARRDLQAVKEAVTADCVFEDTEPPDGRRYEGRAEVSAVWARFFSESPHASFETEEAIAGGGRAVVRWTYRWTSPGTPDGHVRGVDVFTVRDGKVAEKLSYVKG